MARKVVVRQRPGRPRCGSESLLSLLDRGAEPARVVACEQKAEVERELQLVGPDKIGQTLMLSRPGLADQYSLLVTVRDTAEAADDVVNLRPIVAVERV